jgi:Resolvase, N terminal domain
MVADIHSGDVATGGHGDQALTHADAAPSRNVLIYIRVSTEKQSQNLLSLNDQENQLVARAKRDGDNIIAIYRDEGETATNMRRAANR